MRRRRTRSFPLHFQSFLRSPVGPCWTQTCCLRILSTSLSTSHVTFTKTSLKFILKKLATFSNNGCWKASYCAGWLVWSMARGWWWRQWTGGFPDFLNYEVLAKRRHFFCSVKVKEFLYFNWTKLVGRCGCVGHLHYSVVELKMKDETSTVGSV